MSFGDKVCVMYKGRELLGLINTEYGWASIVYMPVMKEQKLLVEQKITKWDKVDWVKKIKLEEEAKIYDTEKRIRDNQRGCS